MKLYIDNREPKNSISYLESLNTDFSNQLIIEIKPLEIGDYMYYDEDNSNNNIIINAISDEKSFDIPIFSNNLFKLPFKKLC